MPTVDVTQWSAKGLISFEAFENWNYISMKTLLPDIKSKFRTIIWRHIMLLVMIYNLVCLISGNSRDHNILYSVRILLPFHIVNKKILEKLPPDICIMIHLKKWQVKINKCFSFRICFKWYFWNCRGKQLYEYFEYHHKGNLIL